MTDEEAAALLQVCMQYTVNAVLMVVVVAPCRLKGADVDASDLRQGAALLLAGVAAEGVTVLRGLEHVDRGYAGLEAKLAALGVRAARRQRAGGP